MSCLRLNSVSGAELGEDRRQQVEIDLASAGVEVELPCRQLAQLAEAAANGQAWQGMLAPVLQQAAGEVAPVEQRAFRPRVEPLHRPLGGRAGAARGMVDTGGARDVQPAGGRVKP